MAVLKNSHIFTLILKLLQQSTTTSSYIVMVKLLNKSEQSGLGKMALLVINPQMP